MHRIDWVGTSLGHAVPYDTVTSAAPGSLNAIGCTPSGIGVATSAEGSWSSIRHSKSVAVSACIALPKDDVQL